MEKVYKYGTGQEVPRDAKYLWSDRVGTLDNYFVWHYFLVEE